MLGGQIWQYWDYFLFNIFFMWPSHGAGHSEVPIRGGSSRHAVTEGLTPGLESEGDDCISSLPVSSDGPSTPNGSHSDATNSNTSPSHAPGRPWTLPAVDGRAPRRRAMPASPSQAPPRVMVHPFGVFPPQEDSAEVWAIRPRAGSGRTSLGRRRRYDSYVSTLDLDDLRELDDELLRRAIGGEGDIPEEENKNGEDESLGTPRRAGTGTESVHSCPRRERREEDGVENARSSSQRGSTGSHHRRELLCDEISGPQERRSHRQGLGRRAHVDLAGARPCRGIDHNADDSRDCRTRHSMPHFQQQPNIQAQSGHQQRMPGVNPNRLSVSQHHSPFRPHRDSISRGAPPPNPTFYDPKMGALPPAAPNDNELYEEGARTPPASYRHSSSRPALEGGIPQLPCVQGSTSNSRHSRRSSLRQTNDAADGYGASSYRNSRRDSRMSFGIGWLYDHEGRKEGDGERGGGGGNEGSRPPSASGRRPNKRTLLHWLDQRLPRMSDEHRIARASLYLSDAIDTRPVRMRNGGTGNLFAYRLSKRTGWLWIMQILAVVHLLLALWEPPRALADSAQYHDSISRHTLTMAASTARHLLGVELVLVLLFSLDLCLEIYALGVGAFFGMNAPPRVLENTGSRSGLQAKLWGQFRLFLVILFFADICAALDSHNESPRFSRPLRPLYLICLSETLKRWSSLLLRLLGQLRDVALGTGIFLGLFSLLGLILFSETGYYAASIPYLNFDDFLNSFLALYVLMTTQNFGALLNPAYTANPQGSSPLYFFFFMAFVLIVVLFLAHLALPRVFWVYQNFQRRQAYESRILERLAILMTFRCLDPQRRGWIDVTSFRSMLRYVRPDFFDLQTGYEKDAFAGATEHMFEELARSHPGRVYPREFLSVCEVILTDYYPCVPTLDRPGMSASEWHQRERARFRAILGSRWVEVGSMALLILTCFFLTFYGSPSISKLSLRRFSYSIVVLFTLELVLKIWAYGPKLFVSLPANVLDLLIVGASFISLLVHALAPPHSPLHQSEQIANLCLLFLVLRVVRLFPNCTIFRKFSSAFRVLPFFLSSFSLCVLISYSWAVLGMALFAKFGDEIPTAIHQELVGWASVDNFNSFWSASVTLFQVATTYDWYRIMYLWMHLTRTPWAAMYFLAFHLVANIVVYQLTAALFIDAFLSFHDKRWVEPKEEEENTEAPALTEGLGNSLPSRNGKEEERRFDAPPGAGASYDGEDSYEGGQSWHQPTTGPNRMGPVPSPTPGDDLEFQRRRRAGGDMGGGGQFFHASVI